MTDGDVTGARRVDGRHDLWEITVEPESREVVTIAVADARVDEAAGALLAFAVTLSRAASGTVTVDFATADGSAQAGVD